MDQGKSNPRLAKLINHQLKIIDKIDEIAKLLEKLSTAKHELKELVRESHEGLDATLQNIEKKE